MELRHTFPLLRFIGLMRLLKTIMGFLRVLSAKLLNPYHALLELFAKNSFIGARYSVVIVVFMSEGKQFLYRGQA